MSSRRPAASASAVRWRSSGRRCRIARRMVVDEDQPGRVEPDGVAEQLADADQRRRHVALVDGRHAEDVVLRVEQDGPQLLALEPAHLEDQPVGDVVRAADGPARGGPVGQQPTAELERGDQLGRARLADPGHRGELQLGRPGEPGQPVVLGEGVGGEVDGRSPARPGAPHQPDQLGRRETADAAQRQAFARPLRRPAPPGSPGRRPARSRSSHHWMGSRIHLVDRPAGSSGRAGTLAGRDRSGDGSPQGPYDGSPPIPPAIRTSRTRHSLGRGAHRRLTRPFTGDPAPAPPRAQKRPIGLGEDEQDPVERGVQAERSPHRASPEEQPAEREGDRDPPRKGRRPRARARPPPSSPPR